MHISIKTLLALFSFSCYACADDVVTVRFDGTKATVSEVLPSDSVAVTQEAGVVMVENLAKAKPLTIRLTGKSDDAQFILKTSTKDRVELSNLTLQSRQGAPIWLKNKKKVEVVALKGTNNTLTVAACPDTANNKAAVIYAKDKLKLSGSGKLACLAPGDGCKGINAKDDIIIEELTLDVKTTGNNLGRDERGFGGFGGPGFGGPMGGPGMGPGGPGFNFDDLPEEVKAEIEEMRKRFENGEFPMGGPGEHHGHGEHGDHGGFGGFGGMGFGGFGGFGGGAQAGPPEGEGPDDANDGGGFKQKYIATCKGIKSSGKVTINSGSVTVYTKSAGAEGIEGKKGVMINGGTVDVNSKDDAINANAPIYFNGGKTTAISRDNDAVDSNPEGGFMPPFFPRPNGIGESEESLQPAGFTPRPNGRGDGGEGLQPLIFIGGGEVYAYSWKGSPEEGLDCDFNPIEVTAGTAFSIGAGMGDMPSVPTAKTAKQPTVLFVGMNIIKGKDIVLKDAKGKELFKTAAPFSFNNSSSLFTCKSLKLGEKYTMECADWKKEFTIEENFSVIR